MKKQKLVGGNKPIQYFIKLKRLKSFRNEEEYNMIYNFNKLSLAKGKTSKRKKRKKQTKKKKRKREKEKN